MVNKLLKTEKKTRQNETSRVLFCSSFVNQLHNQCRDRKNDYKDMREVQQYELVEWPSADICENFSFETNAAAGTFTFYFKWINNRWNCWVTLPDGTTREAGVQPNIHDWSGFSDYGLYFKSDLNNIDYNSLFLTELYILTWL